MNEFLNINVDEDTHYMQLALALAKQGQYTTRPNPAVGCVIVKNGHIIGQGFHPKAGMPHAEVYALRSATESVVGATAYVTLEPCAHFGKTPPCAEALVNAGVARVVIATLDANPQVAGIGLAKLQAAGIATTVGVCQTAAQELNAGFLKTMAGGLPFVRLKIAASLDGRTAMASGESKWITGSAARLDVQHFRAISGAIITGIGTVLADDPQLNVRELNDSTPIEKIPQPLRVVLDRQGRMPKTATILTPPNQTLLVGQSTIADVETWPNQSLTSLLEALKIQKNIHDVLVECGATLASAFIQEKLVDELIIYIAPTLLGCTAKPMFSLPFEHLSEQVRFDSKHIDKIGADIRLILTPHYLR